MVNENANSEEEIAVEFRWQFPNFFGAANKKHIKIIHNFYSYY